MAHKPNVRKHECPKCRYRTEARGRLYYGTCPKCRFDGWWTALLNVKKKKVDADVR